MIFKITNIDKLTVCNISMSSVIKQYREKEDAVSPVIATILMVAITVVLAGTLYVWAASLAESNTEGSLNLYSFEARESPSMATTNTDDSLAILTMTRGEDTSWSVLSIQLSINGAASVACAVPGQTDGNCVVVDTSDNTDSWTSGEDVTVLENGVDLCNDINCEMTFSILNLRTSQTLSKASTGSETITNSEDYTAPTTPNQDNDDDNLDDDNQGGDDNNDNGNDNTNSNQCTSSSECMLGGFCMNGECVYDDQDTDGISDSQDNCPQNANADQADSDQDGTGDACDATPYGPMTTYYPDADGDTYGDVNQPYDAYTQPAGYVTNFDDCNDQDPSLNLLNSQGNCAPEPAINTYYLDADSDTYGDITQTTQATSQPAGYVTNSDDCDDSNPSLNLLNSNGDCAPEPQPSVVEAMTQTSVVNSVMQSGHKYVFNDGTVYDENTQYGLGDGTYTFSNIGITHPMAILNDGKVAEISYTSSNDPIVIKVSGGSFSAPYYDFTDANGNAIDIYNGDFGFMRGQTYVFEADGIASNHPFRVYSDGSYSQSISGSSSSITVSIPTGHSTTAGDLFYDCALHSAMKGDMQILNAAVDGTNYDFYYGDITVTVSGDFDVVSVYCLYHGYMGGQDMLVYGSGYEIVDATAPVITVLGNNPATVELGSTYTDAGATADGGETVTTSGTVDTNTVGVYTITYTATDSSGNQGTATRTVNVVDTTAPVITVLGNNPVNIQVGSVYNDAGASATDTLDGDLTSTINVVNNVDANTVGTYTVTYDVTDSTGNQATQAVRTVNVNSAANTAPSVDSIMLSTSNDDGLVYSDVTLTCTPTTSDADGDTVTTSITWTADGNQIGTGSSITLTTSLVDIADAVYCTVTPNDGTVDGTPVDSVSATVVNYAPTISSVTIDNTSPTIGDTLTCSAASNDAEGHSLTTTYTWYVNSAEQSPTSPTFDTTGLSDSDVIYCSARVVDAYGAPAVLQSSSVTVTAGSGPTTHYIDIQNYAYSPSTITINVGDTIIWTNLDSMDHTVTSDDGVTFDSNYISTGGTFSFTFTSTGTFGYHCSPHPGMTATVIVQ